MQTESVAVQTAREKALRALLKQAPQSERLIRLTQDFGIRIDPAPDGCIRCLLCERICKEVVGAGALKLGKRDGKRLIQPVEGRCIGCGTCANICPTHVILVTDDENVRTISIAPWPLVRAAANALPPRSSWKSPTSAPSTTIRIRKSTTATARNAPSGFRRGCPAPSPAATREPSA